MRLLLPLLFALLTPAPATAAQRTFVFSPADVVQIVDGFNGEVLGHAPSFSRRISIHGGALRFFGRSCPSLSSGGYTISRIRVLDGAARAAQLAGRPANFALGSALQSMGGAAWGRPAFANALQPRWVVDTSVQGTIAFSTAGFATGDPNGAIGASAVADMTPSFLFSVDLFSTVTDGPVSLVLALTADAPRPRPGRMPRRTECFLVASLYPADLRALSDLVAETPMPDTTRSRLTGLLDDVHRASIASQPNVVRRFAYTVAHRIGTEIPADAGEKMIARAFMVIDALGL